MRKIFYPFDDIPAPSEYWISCSDSQRKESLNNLLNETIYKDYFKIINTKNDGQVIVSFLQSLKASERGTLLLDMENFLKKNIDQSITVWAESLGDKNSLRNLRGIEVKND